jgi:hypothetical protein
MRVVVWIGVVVSKSGAKMATRRQKKVSTTTKARGGAELTIVQHCQELLVTLSLVKLSHTSTLHV